MDNSLNRQQATDRNENDHVWVLLLSSVQVSDKYMLYIGFKNKKTWTFADKREQNGFQFVMIWSLEV